MSQNADLFRVDMGEMLVSTALRLSDEFQGVFGLATIERFLHESFEELEAQGSVSRFTPLIAERKARESLRDIVRGGQQVLDVHHVLFIGSNGGGRASIAAAMLDHLTPGDVHVCAVGTRPAESVDPLAVQVLAEVGIVVPDTHLTPQGWDDAQVVASDVVVTLGSGACPLVYGHHYEDWSAGAPLGRTIDEARATCQDVSERVMSLAHDLGLAA